MMKRPEVERKAAVGWGSYDDVHRDAEDGARDGPYLLGDKFTAADLYIGSELNFAVMFGAPGLKGEPVFDAYLARLTARPAFQRAMAGNGPIAATRVQQPRLATILFADVAGYSRMMRADEEQTLVDLRAHLAELVAPVIARFHGRIVKTVGDGVMVEFGSAVEAMRSAVELQRGMVERNADLPAERRQTFRIGLHLGDVILTDQDVFGDTVNVAARLQALAEPGSIVLSRSVYDQVRDKLPLPFRDLGRARVEEHRPAAAGLFGGRATRRGPAARRRRVAVVAGLAVAVAADRRGRRACCSCSGSS